MSNGTKVSECNILSNDNSHTILPEWKGIPYAVMLNALIGSVLLIVLACLRCLYHIRKPYLNDWNIDWHQFIYSDRTAQDLHPKHLNRLHPDAYYSPAMQPYTSHITNKYPNEHYSGVLFGLNDTEERIRRKHQRELDNVGKRRCWLWDYLCIEDQLIYELRGNDAYEYFLFQRYIIYLLAMLTIVCLVILVPVNVIGRSGGARDSFETTTIQNVPDNSPLLWVHLIVAVLLVITGLIMMKRFSDQIFIPKEMSDERTILVQNVLHPKRDAKELKEFIEHKFPRTEVTRITFTYDVDHLDELGKNLYTAQNALYYSEKYHEYYGKRLKINVHFGARCMPCCCTQTDAISYYRSEQAKIESEIKAELDRLKHHPEHAVFVQLRTRKMARHLVEHFERTTMCRCANQCFNCCCTWSGSKKYDPFGYNQWIVQSAPFADDIDYKDVIMNTNTSGICAIVMNILIALVCLCLTTPLVALGYFDEIMKSIGVKKDTKNNALNIGELKFDFMEYMSFLLMVALTSMLPNLVMFMAQKVPNVYKSDKTHKAMMSAYVFLLFMVVIFPSLGLASARLLIMKMLEEPTPHNLYKCLFPPESSVWFVHYVIAAAFFDNAFELMHLPELCFYLWNGLIYPRTEAEYARARLETDFQFSFVYSYPNFLLVFTIVTTYSVACPIIAPCGLSYMLLKYMVDRYLLFYYYSTPDIIGPRVHQTAITFVLVSFLFTLLQLGSYLTTRKTSSGVHFEPATVCTFAFIIYLCFLCSLYGIFHCLYYRQNDPFAAHSARSLSNHNNATVRSGGGNGGGGSSTSSPGSKSSFKGNNSAHTSARKNFSQSKSKKSKKKSKK